MQAAIQPLSHAAQRRRVAVIGGLTRATHLWTRAGDDAGVEVMHHDGNTHGGRLGEINAAVWRADLVIIITEPNSHGGVAAARKAALAAQRPHILVKRLRPAALAAAIEDALALARTRGATP